jgi:hypothetical protein
MRRNPTHRPLKIPPKPLGEFSLNWVGVEVVPHAPAPDQRGASRFWSQRRQKAPQPQEHLQNGRLAYSYEWSSVTCLHYMIRMSSSSAAPSSTVGIQKRLAFLSIDEEVTSCSSRNEGKGPPSPSLPGILEELPQNRSRRCASLQKRRRRPQTHPELENPI